MATHPEIEAYLIELNEALCNSFILVPRSKNQNTLSRLGITHQQIIVELQTLTPVHYYSGPSPDHDPMKGGFIWVFKKEVNGEMLYIKLKIYTVRSVKHVKCLSFHEDESN